MLKHQLLHPQINAALAQTGHHAKILIADGNYPASTKKGPHAQTISLNLAPGIVTCAQVLTTLLTAIPIQTINTMGIPPDDPYAQKGEPPIWSQYRNILKNANQPTTLQPIQKWDFYQTVASPDHALTIQTADQALWANLLLTIGVRQT